MESKSNKLLLISIGVGAILLALVGMTFAYFVASVTGDAQQVSVQAKAPTPLSYIGGQAISIQNAAPGDSVAKSFQIQNADTKNTHKYDLKLVIDNNTFVNTEGANQLVINITASTNKSSGGNKPVPKATYDVTNKTVASNGHEEPIVTGQVISPSETHTYSVTLTFNNLSGPQDTNQSAKFSAHFSVTNDQVYKAN